MRNMDQNDRFLYSVEKFYTLPKKKSQTSEKVEMQEGHRHVKQQTISISDKSKHTLQHSALSGALLARHEEVN